MAGSDRFFWIYASLAKDLFIGAAFPLVLAVLFGLAGAVSPAPGAPAGAALSVSVLLAVATVLVLVGLRIARRVRRLLATGRIGVGRIVRVEKRVPWWAKHQRSRTAATYVYDTPQGSLSARIEKWTAAEGYGWLKHEAPVHVVYDPARPGDHLLLHPEDPRANRSGQVGHGALE